MELMHFLKTEIRRGTSLNRIPRMRENVMFITNLEDFYYAPNFEEVVRAYYFGLVHPFVHLYIMLLRSLISSEPCMLGF